MLLCALFICKLNAYWVMLLKYVLGQPDEEKKELLNEAEEISTSFFHLFFKKL